MVTDRYAIILRKFDYKPELNLVFYPTEELGRYKTFDEAYKVYHVEKDNYDISDYFIAIVNLAYVESDSGDAVLADTEVEYIRRRNHEDAVWYQSAADRARRLMEKNPQNVPMHEHDTKRTTARILGRIDEKLDDDI